MFVLIGLFKNFPQYLSLYIIWSGISEQKTVLWEHTLYELKSTISEMQLNFGKDIVLVVFH